MRSLCSKLSTDQTARLSSFQKRLDAASVSILYDANGQPGYQVTFIYTNRKYSLTFILDHTIGQTWLPFPWQGPGVSVRVGPVSASVLHRLPARAALAKPGDDHQRPERGAPRRHHRHLLRHGGRGHILPSSDRAKILCCDCFWWKKKWKRFSNQ